MFFVIARMASLVLAVLATPLSVLLLIVGQSFESRLFGIAGMMIGVSPLLVCLGVELERRWLKWTGGLGCLGWLGLTVALYSLAPDGKRPKGARIQHRYAEGAWGFQRQALGNLLPELDQFLLGFKVVPLMDSYFTFEQSRELSAWTAEIYRELEADADFHALGSVMPVAYADLWLGRGGQGHSFLYVPPGLKRDVPAPVLVFLHGSGGSFKAYPWLLSQMADELGLVLICPSYGMGNWNAADSAGVVEAALADAENVVRLDRGKMHLMGLSNGGKGLGHAGRDLGEKFASLTFISPVVETGSIKDPRFIGNWQGKPVFIITGAKDDRVPLESVTYVSSVMKKNGAQVTLKTVPQADHFLLFSHRREVIAQLKEWLEEAMKAEAVKRTE
ncbi:prolyl oligopeptidase family protein [Prosthecobacter fusiformis]|uniref:Prolyl oligopeptidase family protein n=1 Tax=Prosthecobacter fusiformis TaxID=48464 RepID=A0A4R7STL7_9BACT|nr:prolyl oligopeptidase family serine peptidase [Prosthecobacter fusiformis]TDU81637.1 prolyl oligopeptidase family protein [Prosthecobacter fusiformis]